MTPEEAIGKWPKIALCHPVLIRRILRVLAAMDALGFPMTIVQGVRTAEYQHSLYEQGRTKPGKIVTNCDGYEKKSNHQQKDDGYGHAIDCAFLTNGEVDWSDDLPWSAYGKCAVAVGLRWGGDWTGTLVDRPHVELPRSV
jgi:peptidoglycan L-alanyl-D-glutamate endopeptidase CwlK